MEIFIINGIEVQLSAEEAITYRLKEWKDRGYETAIYFDKKGVPLGSSLLKIDDYDKKIDFYYCSELSCIIDTVKSKIINHPKDYGFRSANQAILYYHQIILSSYNKNSH